MKIYAISDLHLSGEGVKKPMNIFGGYVKGYVEEVKKNWDKIVEDEDIVLISGDISWATCLKDAQIDLDFIGKLKGKKVMIKGKYDYWWSGKNSVRNALHKSTYVLQNDCIREDGVVICGSRGYPIEDFYTRKDKRNLREQIRFSISLNEAEAIRQVGDVLIVMMHYPPFNSKLEDSEFTVKFKEYNVDKVVYGHLHGQNIQTPLYYVKDNIEYYLTSCDIVNNKLVRIL